MSTPRRPSRLAVYTSDGSYYPRELVESNGILYIIDATSGAATPLNQISEAIKDSDGNILGTINNKDIITIPASTATKYGLVKLSSTNGSTPGTAAPGTSNAVARADHVHPLQTTVSGNAGSASKLQTARKISLTGEATGSADFDGSKAIEIAVTLGVGAAAKSNSYNDLDNLPSIPVAGTTDPSAAGTATAGTAATFARADHVHPLQTTVSGNAGSASKLQTARKISLTGGAVGSADFDGSKAIDINITKIDASKVSGVLSLDNIPQGALERLVPVKDDTARKALTSSDVQNGDVVKVQSTGLMYYVVDDTKLGNASTVESAFEAFTAGSASAVPWEGVTGKPSFGKVATSNSYNDLDDKPTIPTIPNLSKGTTSGSGNVVTDVTVSGHQITLTKGITALTAHPTISMGTNGTDTASSPAHGGSFTVVSSISKDSNGHVTKYNTKTVNLPSETSLTKASDDSEGNVISDISVSGHQITISKITALTAHQTIPNLSKGDTSGTGNVVTDIAVSGHKITLTKGITALTAHPTISTTATPSDPTTASTLSHGGTFVIPTTLTRDSNGHLTAIGKTKYQLPSETSLSLGTTAGSGNVVTGISVTGHQITVTKGITALTSHQTIPNLSKGTTGGNGNVVTDITVSGHQITLTKGITALTSHQTIPDVVVDVPTTGNVLTGVSVDTDNKHKLVFTKGTALTSETSLTKGTTSGSGNVVTDLTVSGHQITLTKGITALTAHPSISMGTNGTTTSAPAFGGTFTAISGITKDSNGHVTAYTTKTVTVPSIVNAANGFGYGTCTTAAATVAKVATLSSYTLKTNGVVAIRFTYDVPASATLNINSTGAKAIYYNNAAIVVGVIKAGDTATFVYNGSYYMLLSVDKATITTSGSGNVVTGITATGNKLTVTKGTAVTSETSLSKATTTGSGNVVTDITVSGHQITLNKGITALTSHQTIPSLSLGTTTGSGNVVTGITVSGHQITMAKGITALTAHPTITQSTNSTNTSSPGFGGTFTAIDSITKDSNGHVTKINTKTVTIPSQTTLSKSTVNSSYAMVGDISVSGHTITVTKKNPSTTYNASVGTTWSGSEAPYTQTITVSGITSTDNPIVDVVLSSDYDTATTELQEYAKIYKITTAANSITVYATEKTENAIKLQLKVVK